MGRAVSAISVILIVCSAVFGMLTKISYKDTDKTNNYDDYLLDRIDREVYEEEPEDVISESDSQDAFLANADVKTEWEMELELFELIDFIAKVRFTGERCQQHMSTLSTVDVIEVYEGDASLAGKQVDVFETNYFDPSGKYRNIGPINLMQKGKEYYVFLMSCNYSPEYQEKLERLRFADYLLNCSVVPVNITNEEIIDPDTPNLTYGKVKHYDYLFFNENSRRNLAQVRENLLEYTGIQQ